MLGRYGEAFTERLGFGVGEAGDNSSWLAMGAGASTAEVGKPSSDEGIGVTSIVGM